MELKVLIFPVLAYLAGSISFGYLIAKIRIHDDIRQYGSKSIGASNISRIMGVSWGLVTVTFDILKAVLILYLIEKYFLTDYLFYNSLLISLCALFTIIGHIFPVFLKFKGGKGVSPFIGAMFYLFPIQTVIFLGLYVVLLMITRYNSLTSMITVAAFPFLILWFKGYQEADIPYYLLCIVLTIIIIIKHKENIKRLLSKTEPKFSFKKKPVSH